VDLLQSLNSVVQGSHHLHLELEELLQSQRWGHRQRLVGALVVLPLLARTSAGAPSVHHLFAAEQN
jgi:predicted YcjX-like family ATPase